MVVEVDERGLPVTVTYDHRSARDTGDDSGLLSCRRIEEIIETWCIDDEWWRVPVRRQYVDVVLEGGAHVVLFEDLTTGQWFIQMP